MPPLTRPATGPTVALVPLRSPGEGKTRLSGALDATERAALAGAMLADVTRALRHAEVDRVVVAAAGPAAAAAASALRLDVLLDPPSATSLDTAISAAEARLGRIAGLFVVTADLPRLQPAEVRHLLDTPGAVIVAPTDDGGTGALLRRPPSAIRTAYGPGSAVAHAQNAVAARIDPVVVDLPGLRHDVDTWTDVVALTSGYVGPATAAFLAGLGPRLYAAG